MLNYKLLFLLGFGLARHSSWDWKARNTFWCTAYNSWTRWMGLQWWEIDNMCCLYPCNVQGGWNIWSCIQLHSSNRVHCMSPNFEHVSTNNLSFLHRHLFEHWIWLSYRFGMHICWGFLRTTIHACQLGATMKVMSFLFARFLVSTKWNCLNTIL